MSYVVLARKWRSGQFADIVGQSHIVQTLMNAIRTDRLHQAYLFTGSRGIGKTSIARIFAKVVRCEKRAENENWLVSCDECASCKEIAGGNSVDVIEIDGASNNGVDAIREIRENAKYLPSHGSKKLYIIDEVHMLTTAAFNALLKTLEEPPPHVIFIFATTEPHKIPATILSRCQRFDFRRPTVAQIHTHLVDIAAREKIQADSSALSLIARAAEGSMRDALSLLDQAIAFAGETLSADSVRESVGLIESQTLLQVLDGVFARDAKRALASVEAAFTRGYDLRVLTKSLIEFLHAIILTKVGADSSDKDFSPEELKEIRRLAEMRPLEEMELIFQALHHGIDWIARSTQPNIVLNILLVKCACAESLVEVGAEEAPNEQPIKTVSPPRTNQPVTTQVQKPSAPAPQTATQKTPAKPAPALATPKPAGATDQFVPHVRQLRPFLASILEHAVHLQVESLPEDKKKLVIHFKAQDQFKFDQLQSRTYQQQLVQIASDYFGGKAFLELKKTDTDQESIAEKKLREAEAYESKVRQGAKDHPVLKETSALFGVQINEIKLKGEKRAE